MRITKDFRFEASHVVPGHPGKCKRLHGHSYLLQVTMHGCVNPLTGFIVDFADLKGMVKPLVETLDHRHMNFFIENPTAENIASWFGQRLQRVVDGLVITGLEVTVLETATSSATWDSREPIDKRHGQNPTMYSTGVPDALVEGAMFAQIGPVQLVAEEYQQYMNTFHRAKRETADKINGIRMASQELIPCNLADMTGTVKEQQ